MTSEHAAAFARLLPPHKDPSNRILLARVEGERATLLTVARRGGPLSFAG